LVRQLFQLSYFLFSLGCRPYRLSELSAFQRLGWQNHQIIEELLVVRFLPSFRGQVSQIFALYSSRSLKKGKEEL